MPRLADRQRTIRRLRSISRLMDSSLRVPGTEIRFGLDPILGLVPIAGDVVSVAFSLYILREAARLGTPRPILRRMAANIGVDVLVGLVPVLGDAGDVFFRANERNLRLMALHAPPAPEAGPQPPPGASR